VDVPREKTNGSSPTRTRTIPTSSNRSSSAISTKVPTHQEPLFRERARVQDMVGPGREEGSTLTTLSCGKFFPLLTLTQKWWRLLLLFQQRLKSVKSYQLLQRIPLKIPITITTTLFQS
jgi:hypothetical protein